MTDTRLITLEDTERAIGFIQPDDRDVWVKMAMSIKSEFGELGFVVWDAWSQSSDLYKSSDAHAVWKSVKSSGRTGIGSLLKLAKDNGFKFSVRDISAEERDRRVVEADKRRAENKQRREADALEHKQKNTTAAARAKSLWPALRTEGKSEYLARKKIHHCGARFSRGSVVVPLWKNGALTGLQFIKADGLKKFMAGTEKQGSYFEIPGTTGETVFCEGFATGCSIWMATHHRVLVAFDAGNLGTVIDEIINHAQGDTHDLFFLAADNDHSKPINKGLEVAEKIVARHAHIKTVWPEFGPQDLKCSDFNDLHVTQGLEAVADYFKEDRAPQVSGAISPPGEGQSQNLEPLSPPDVAELVDNENWAEGIARNKKSMIPLNLASNVTLVLDNDHLFKTALSYCDFSYRIIKRRKVLPEMHPGEWVDADSSHFLVDMSRRYGFEPSDGKLAHGLIVSAQRNRFHPIREYLDGLKWDGEPRLDRWLEDIYESSACHEFNKLAGTMFLIGSVARVFDPGCKMDNVMILEGLQGLKKSSSIDLLYCGWFSDAPIPLGEKDSYQSIQGVWCQELGELDSFNKAESTTAKNFFSQRIDRYRPSYGRFTQDFPRQTVFIGTTNQSEYLKDHTGNRRYWPVRCLTVNIDLLRETRDQYWAEAVHRYRQHERWWPETEEEKTLFKYEQDSRMQLDPWQYAIEDYMLKESKDYYTSEDILVYAIQKDLKLVTRADQNRIAPIMKAIGWRNTRKRIPVGKKTIQRHVYVKAESDDG